MDKKERRELLKRKEQKGLTVVADNDEAAINHASRSRFWKRLLILFLLVLLVAGAGLYISVSSRSYNAYEVIASYEIEDVTSMEYLAYGDNYIKYSKDGVSYVDRNNHTVWMESYAMKMPRAVVAGDYIAIADFNGNQVYLFGREGKLNQTTTQYTIIDVDVALQGVFAVVLESDTGNLILTYDKNGKKISENFTTAESSGYPLDIALSADGQKLVTSYVCFDGVAMKNQLGTYNFGSVGQNENADRFMGGFDLEDTLVSKVVFFGEHTICAFGDNQLLFYSMKEKPSELTKVALNSEIKSIFYNTAYVGIVYEKENAQKLHQYEMKAYNASGREVVSLDIDIPYKHIRATENRIIVS
ncbi:MAG: hypothetical protein K2G89_06225, partial [Lachnospiraceae bacterium]|nr:hypothetical protein [Lachnospiraceae bacterium]